MVNKNTFKAKIKGLVVGSWDLSVGRESYQRTKASHLRKTRWTLGVLPMKLTWTGAEE